MFFKKRIDFGYDFLLSRLVQEVFAIEIQSFRYFWHKLQLEDNFNILRTHVRTYFSLAKKLPCNIMLIYTVLSNCATKKFT